MLWKWPLILLIGPTKQDYLIKITSWLTTTLRFLLSKSGSNHLQSGREFCVWVPLIPSWLPRSRLCTTNLEIRITLENLKWKVVIKSTRLPELARSRKRYDPRVHTSSSLLMPRLTSLHPSSSKPRTTSSRIFWSLIRLEYMTHWLWSKVLLQTQIASSGRSRILLEATS